MWTKITLWVQLFLVLSSLSVLQGCSSLEVALANRGHGGDYLNTLDNPIFKLEADQEVYKQFSVYYEHISSVPDMSDRPGTNMFGLKYKVW